MTDRPFMLSSPPDAEMLPRVIDIGPLRLDLFHRDGRCGEAWLGLHPREFELLWFLARAPGRAYSRRELLAAVWRLDHEPGTNRVAVHVARIRAKLDQCGLRDLLRTRAGGGYYISAVQSAPSG